MSTEEQNPETQFHPPSQEQPPPNDDKNKQIATERDEEHDDPETTLQGFTKNRLGQILKALAHEDTKIWDTINREADCTSSHRQIYVRSDAPFSAESLVDYFNKFGQVSDCKTAHDRDSGLYYGFILFKDRIGASKALKDNRMKCIGEVNVYCGFPEEDHFPELAKRRVYVGAIKEEINEDKLTEFFSEFGEIEEGLLGVDKITGKIKGNCCFVYKTRESAKEAIKVPEKIFEGHTLRCHLDSRSDVSDGDPEPEYLPDPSLPSSSTGPQGATDPNSNPGTGTLPGRVHDDAVADKSPIPTPPHHHGSSAPSIPEPVNSGISQTSPSSIPQGATANNAGPGRVNGDAGAEQNPVFTNPHHQGSSIPSIPEPENPPNPGISLINSSGLPLGALLASYFSIQWYAYPGIVRAYQEGADQNLCFIFLHHQGSSTPANTESENPSNPQGDPYYDACLYVALPYAGAHQNPFFTFPHHQGSPIPSNQYGQGSPASSAPGYPYDQGSANVHPSQSHTPSGGSNQEQSGRGNQGQPGRCNRRSGGSNQGQLGRGNEGQLGRRGNQGHGNRPSAGSNQGQLRRGNRPSGGSNQRQLGPGNRGRGSSHHGWR